MKKLTLTLIWMLLSSTTYAYTLTDLDRAIITNLEPKIQVMQETENERFMTIIDKLDLLLPAFDKDSRVYVVLDYLQQTMYWMIPEEETVIDELDLWSLLSQITAPSSSDTEDKLDANDTSSSQEAFDDEEEYSETLLDDAREEDEDDDEVEQEEEIEETEEEFDLSDAWFEFDYEFDDDDDEVDEFDEFDEDDEDEEKDEKFDVSDAWFTFDYEF